MLLFCVDSSIDADKILLIYLESMKVFAMLAQHLFVLFKCYENLDLLDAD
jgi:hypothetical protein